MALNKCIQQTIDKYREEEGEEYISISPEEAAEIILHDTNMNKTDRAGEIYSMRLRAGTHVDIKRRLPAFVFVAPLAFRRWKEIKKQRAAIKELEKRILAV